MVTQNIKKDKKIYKTLGPEGAKLLTDLTKNNQVVFSIEDAAIILKKQKSKVWGLLKDLTKKGWLHRIEKGKYLMLPLGVSPEQPYIEHHFIIASKLIHPYYIGYWSMLNYYGYTEQLSNTVFIASIKRKKETTIAGVNYKFISLPEYKMFGLVDIVISNVNIRTSDREKTIIDCLDHPEFCGGIVEAAKGLWSAREDIDFTKLVAYSEKIGNSAVAKRLGYLLETLHLREKIEIESLQRIIAKGFSPLDPLLPKEGRTISRWNLILNISEEELLSWRRV